VSATSRRARVVC